MTGTAWNKILITVFLSMRLVTSLTLFITVIYLKILYSWHSLN